jgi:hypothetical protein
VLGEEAIRAGWQLASVTLLCGLALAVSVWRTAWFGKPARTTVLGTVFAAGVVLGTALTPGRSDLGLLPLWYPTSWEWEVLTSGAIAIGCWASAGYMALTARAWTGLRKPVLSRLAAVLGIALSAAVVTGWLTPILRTRLDLSSWLLDPPAVVFADGSVIPDEIMRWVTPFGVEFGGFRWVFLVTVAVFPAFGPLSSALRKSSPVPKDR